MLTYYVRKEIIPSVLHISCAFGDCYFGEVKLEKSSVFNIAGEVTSFFQHTIEVSEKDPESILFNSICFHQKAACELGKNKFTGSIDVKAATFFFVI